jgi:DNA-binding TFAR19-related protein (PDSD5 family)
MTPNTSLTWTPDAEACLRRVPEGTVRHLARQRVEELARRQGESTVTLQLMEERYGQWSAAQSEAAAEMVWTPEARGRIDRAPPFVRGMVVKAVEAYARKQGFGEITAEVLEGAKGFWTESGQFHRP